MLWFLACSGDGSAPGTGADVVEVATTGSSGAYTFSVTLNSPDVDCHQYVNWWEVLSPEGALLYRRILNHSHADEQPFSRTGGPVKIADNDQVVVRGHMEPSGYGGVAFTGSVANGFTEDLEITPDFAVAVAEQPPLPKECWY